MSFKQANIILVACLVGFGVAARFLPHPPNFAPIAALALFGACFLPKKWGLLIPMGAMLFSDWIIGFYTLPVMLSVYGSFTLTGLIGVWLKKRRSWYSVGGAALGSALLFFLATNFSVWAFTPLYEKTVSGLFQCFVMALPFFRNTVLGNLFYASCFFGVYELANAFLKRKYANWRTQEN